MSSPDSDNAVLAAGKAPQFTGATPARRPAVTSVEDLVEGYYDAVYRFAVRWTGSPGRAEDLVQDTFLVAQEKFDQLRNRERPLSWLLQIFRSRAARRGRGKLPTEAVPVEEVAVAPVPEPPVDRQAVVAAIDGLPDEFREAVLLFYFEDLKYREIAEVLECPIGTVMSRLARGKVLLRQALAGTVGEDA